MSTAEETSASTELESSKWHEKVFEVRESLLTELFRNTHIRTLRHIIIAVLIIVCADILIYDLTAYGRLNLDFELYLWMFDGFMYTMFCIWLPMKLSILFLVYAGIREYARLRSSCSENKKKPLDKLFILLYISFLVLFILLPICNIEQMSIGNRIIVLMEQTRLVMKAHAFIRSTVPRVLTACEKDDSSPAAKPLPCPQFTTYLYFLFAPTLVYRDQYPRINRPVQWSLVLNHFGEIFVCIIYIYCLFDRVSIPIFRTFKIREMTVATYIHLVTMSIIPGGLILVNGFFSLLHSWHNAWAEMLLFGDRLFYTDWWNSTTFNMYYRKWNVLVQDWLYNYIYRDIYELLGKRKAYANFGVIFTSAVVHEYILSFVFGFFYPVMFFLFSGIGFVFLFLRVKNPNSASWNVFIWIALFGGVGLNLSLFSLEWYARKNNECPRVFDSILDYFLPRSILCSLWF